MRLGGIDDRAKQVEDSGELERFPDGTDELHGASKELGMQIDDACFVETAVQLVNVIGELNTMLGNHVGCSAGRRGGIVAVLGHLIAGTGNDEAAGGRAVEGVLAVAASTYDVDITVAMQGNGNASLQDTVAKAKQFVDGDAAHLQGREQSSNLFVGVLAVGYANQDVLHLFTSQLLVVQ